MADDPPMEPGTAGRDSATATRRRVVAAGHRGDLEAIEAARGDPDPSVRAARLGALDRVGRLTVADVVEALADPDAVVRRRAAILGARVSGPGSRSTLPPALIARLHDPDPLVAESAAWALGERGSSAAVAGLTEMAGGHDDARCREAAVAALGAIGDPGGLGAVLGALEDRPPVRRRAVVALAGFQGDEVEAALEACLADPDWQVRQAAEVLLER
jgi:HEAT repeat protein